jgi:hypothetical protein
MSGYIKFPSNPVKNINMPLFPTFRQQTSYNHSMKSIFSNNANVYYKPHSLASGGIGTVKNSRRKWKHT